MDDCNCEICEKHGDGSLYYLNPKNYGRQLYRRSGAGYVPDAIEWRQKRAKWMNEFIDVITTDPQRAAELRKLLDDGFKENEPCQVIPLKHAIEMVEIAQPAASMSCVCRKLMRATDERSPEEYSCMGLGVGMLKWERWPERYRGGVKFLSKQEAKDWLIKWDKKGMMHALMVYGTGYEGRPFMGGICNCDYPDCIAMRNRLDLDIKHNLLKSHYVATVDYDLCNGCGICVARCQFGAAKKEVTMNKSNIDMFRCFGCGLCETGCPRGAIKLAERKTIPALKEEW